MRKWRTAVRARGRTILFQNALPSGRYLTAPPSPPLTMETVWLQSGDLGSDMKVNLHLREWWLLGVAWTPTAGLHLVSVSNPAKHHCHAPGRTFLFFFFFWVILYFTLHFPTLTYHAYSCSLIILKNNPHDNQKTHQALLQIWKTSSCVSSIIFIALDYKLEFIPNWYFYVFDNIDKFKNPRI